MAKKTQEEVSYKDAFFLRNFNEIYKKYFSNKREKLVDQMADLDDLDQNANNTGNNAKEAQ